MKTCTRCIYDETVSSITFDEGGVCNYCHLVDRLCDDYQTGTAAGTRTFEKIVEQIKLAGRGNRYDCVVGVSGGTDSSYLLHAAIEIGLRPLAVHFDDTWNSATATVNLQKVLSSLDIDLETYVVDNKEMEDIVRSFFLAGVAEICGPTDLAYAMVLRQVAAKHGVKFILEGHSFMTEGITPLGRSYFDGRYIKSIHRRYGRLPMRTFPLMTLTKFLRSAVVDRVKFIRPLWYLDYSKVDARELLSKSYDWSYYGGHHLESRLAAFYHSVYLPLKFGVDMRNNVLAAAVRQGVLDRDSALVEYSVRPDPDPELVRFFKKRLELDDELYESVMAQQPRDWTEFPTYKRWFERLRPLFAVLVKADLVPRSFYLKYCFPVGAQS